VAVVVVEYLMFAYAVGCSFALDDLSLTIEDGE
jgi:hypothetical protein